LKKFVFVFFKNKKECIFLMEPDFWQYFGDRRQEGGTLSGEFLRDLFNDYVREIKSALPNALIRFLFFF
jgi:hypothetical protein